MLDIGCESHVQLNRTDRVGHSVASATQGAVEAPQTIPDFKLNSSNKKVLRLLSAELGRFDRLVLASK
jgi:hypothetical protein